MLRIAYSQLRVDRSGLPVVCSDLRSSSFELLVLCFESLVLSFDLHVLGFELLILSFKLFVLTTSERDSQHDSQDSRISHWCFYCSLMRVVKELPREAHAACVSLIPSLVQVPSIRRGAGEERVWLEVPFPLTRCKFAVLIKNMASIKTERNGGIIMLGVLCCLAGLVFLIMGIGQYENDQSGVTSSAREAIHKLNKSTRELREGWIIPESEMAQEGEGLIPCLGGFALMFIGVVLMVQNTRRCSDCGNKVPSEHAKICGMCGVSFIEDAAKAEG